jgi:FlaA1/EpsC-like NDP-sugar epimerase
MAAISTTSELRGRRSGRLLRRLAIPLVDAAAWVTALTAATWFRYEFDLAEAAVQPTALLWMTVVATHVLWCLGVMTSLYFGRYPTGSLDEALHLARVTVLVGLAVFAVCCLAEVPPVPRSVPLIACPLALAISFAVRVLIRGQRSRRTRPSRLHARRAIVYGVSERGEELVRAMLGGAAGNTIPVAVLDDDPSLRRARVAGIPVRGTGRELAAVVRDTEAQMLVVAGAASELQQGIIAQAHLSGLEVRILPDLNELLHSPANPREVDVTELLGRQQVHTDLTSFGSWLRGRSVLVTGAGGSIGAELCRQLHRFDPGELVMLDRDESALHALQLSIRSWSCLDSPEVVLGDIRDAEAIRAVMRERRPDIVFHAAALKHLSVLERYPAEAWKTNVLGTLSVLEAAQAAGVGRFVNISTDKAANPTSVLGRSKRIGERLVADAARRTGDTYLSVRFGNVLGSRGSVLTTFTEQIATGRPVTVTHPDATRFLMTAQEAVQLAIQAASIGSAGEVLVLDMGSPARITELAERLMTISGRRSQIVYTGLGRGEKLTEQLFGDGEQDWRPVHPAISHVPVPALTPRALHARCVELGPAAAMAVLVDESTCGPADRPFGTIRPPEAGGQRAPVPVTTRVTEKEGLA